jgi:psp operon transcriptional activator
VVERAVYRADDPESPIDRIILDPFESPFRPRSTPTARGVDSTGADAPSVPRPPSGPYDFFAHIAATEQAALRIALECCGGNQKKTAVHLGMAYHQLRNLLRKHGMLSGSTANSPQSDDMIDEDEQGE